MNLKTDTTKGVLAARLIDLRREFAKGRQRMEELDRQRQSVSETLLRISGAIQVLEELSRHAERPDDLSHPRQIVSDNEIVGTVAG